LRGLDQAPRRILLLEGSYYGWTPGLLLEALDRRPLDKVRGEAAGVPHDELWFDPAAIGMCTTNVPFRSYMWGRARYFIDEFLRGVDSASDPVERATTYVAHLPRAAVRSFLRERLHRAMVTAMTGTGTIISLPPLKGEVSESQCIGFVGVALTREVGDIRQECSNS